MDAFQDFLTQMASQLPEEFFQEESELTLQKAHENATLRAAYLWSLLQIIHEDLNALCRRNANAILGSDSVRAINRTFNEVRLLLEGTSTALFLGSLDEHELPPHSDALVMVSLYRSALRWFRVNHLHEDPFSIS